MWTKKRDFSTSGTRNSIKSKQWSSTGSKLIQQDLILQIIDMIMIKEGESKKKNNNNNNFWYVKFTKNLNYFRNLNLKYKMH